MSVTNYKLAEGPDTPALEASVAALIVAGYQPYGFPMVVEGDRVAQAMVQGNPTVDQATVTAFQPADPTISVPTTGQTVTVTPTGFLTSSSIEPAGTIAALTLTLGNGTISGQSVLVKFSQIVTALTVTATNMDATPYALPTAASVNLVLRFIWNNTAVKWTLV